MIYTLGFLKNVVFLPLITAAILTFIATPAVITIAKFLNLVDDPKKRPHAAHTEKRVIPRAGGLALFFGFLAATFLFIPFSKQIVGIVLGAAVLVIVGLIDDKTDLNPYFRLFGANLLAALLSVGAGAAIIFITNPFGGVIHLDFWRITFNFLGQHSFLPIADAVAILWIVWSMNMVGWSGGVDGQMPGFVAISAAFIGIISLGQVGIENFSIWTTATLAFITAGAYLGFLPWNVFPQKIMPGYGGKALAGFLLATIAILSAAKVGTAILVLGVPLIDSFYVAANRLLHGHSPVLDTRNHLHHRLLDAGWTKRQVALFYWGLSAILGIIALTLNAQQKLFTFVVLGVGLGMMIIWLNFYISWQKKSASGNGLKT